MGVTIHDDAMKRRIKVMDHAAWDFPLSRSEKMKLLLLSYETESCIREQFVQDSTEQLAGLLPQSELACSTEVTSAFSASPGALTEAVGELGHQQVMHDVTTAAGPLPAPRVPSCEQSLQAEEGRSLATELAEAPGHDMCATTAADALPAPRVPSREQSLQAKEGRSLATELGEAPGRKFKGKVSAARPSKWMAAMKNRNHSRQTDAVSRVPTPARHEPAIISTTANEESATKDVANSFSEPAACTQHSPNPEPMLEMREPAIVSTTGNEEGETGYVANSFSWLAVCLQDSPDPEPEPARRERAALSMTANENGNTKDVENLFPEPAVCTQPSLNPEPMLATHEPAVVSMTANEEGKTRDVANSFSWQEVSMQHSPDPEPEPATRERAILSTTADEEGSENDVENVFSEQVQPSPDPAQALLGGTCPAWVRRLRSHNEPTLERVTHGSNRVLVTAPHSIYLLRDGEAVHMVEEHTSDIMQGLAERLQGVRLSWTSLERQRNRKLWEFGRQQGDGSGMYLDARNRDPNYLLSSELPGSPWFREMASLVNEWRNRVESEADLLHVDVHGCRNPPASPAHLTIGLGAMYRRAQLESLESVAAIEEFAAALQRELRRVIIELKLPASGELVHVILGSNRNAHERFSGAWPEESHRLTQSQQAVSFAGFTHALQLEMSRDLRKILVRSKGSVSQVACALQAAWSTSRHLAFTANVS
eukprot:TRINITY_DN8569_c0_g1_i2.p1 TRINITY_DN8569_c0_g1~~TRINITY_DN8569_c0_g1_i2.p1  ORF type:complete len:720 (+),score=102.82 TRINITY_DN8569_c0_g1_i2:30-2162(+)